MRNITGTLIVLLMLLSSNVAFGEMKEDGNQLLSDCNDYIYISKTTSLDDDSILRSDRKAYGAIRCRSTLKGIGDLGYAYEIYLKKQGKKPLFCIPEGVTHGQVAMVVVKYLNEHPELLHEYYSVLIFKAFEKAFPCK